MARRKSHIRKGKKGKSRVRMHHLKSKRGRKHPGFKAVQKKIASREGVSRERAGAILAAASRRNKKHSGNKRLKRVKG